MSATTHGDTRQIVVFELSHEQYGLPIEQVQEIIRYATPRNVSTPSPWVEGVINLRGNVVPVWNLARRLGIPAADDQAANIAIVETPQGTVGLIVNHVTEVLTIDAAQIDPIPAVSDSAVGDVAKLDGRLVILLDPSALVGASEVAA